MAQSRTLGALADAAGILPSYVDQRGETVRTSDEARIAVLAAMRIDASSDAKARAALAELRAADNNRPLAPVVVTSRPPTTITVAVPRTRGPVEWTVAVTTENGRRHEATGRAAATGAALRIPLPMKLPLGYHQVRVSLASPGSAAREAEQTIVVTPARCPMPADRRRGRGVCGLLANLYTVRSAHNWGAGDFGDLRALVDWCAELGAAFVGVNPLHAIANRDDEISPYRPISRLYRNPLYLRIGDVPELRDDPALRARVESGAARRELDELRAADRVEYARVMALKCDALRGCHRVFADRHRDRDTPRGRAYRAYREQEGAILEDFATFMAIHESRAANDPAQRDWRAWPAALRDARGAGIARFRDEHRDGVDFHCWVQFELMRQLGAVADAARGGGLAIGVYQDLAIGSSPNGSDTWGFGDLFLDGASIGAPPDEYSATGQNWGLPPIDPRALARDRYRYWTRLVRNALQHAGALRIDHVMGLFRQFWIPAGKTGTEGAYVRFPADDLLGILALEATRAGALVVGEDLGTVPRGLPTRLARWGVLSTRVLYFSRTKSGAFLPADRYPARALVSANTHDMAPLAGFWEGRDLELRRNAGILATDAALAEAREGRARERRALVRRLAADGLSSDAVAHDGEGDVQVDATAVIAAVHAFLGRIPAALVGVSLDDLAREHTPVNLPGVGLDGYPSWMRRLGADLADLRRAPEVATMLAGLRRLLRPPPGRRRRTTDDATAQRSRRRRASG